MYSTWALLLAIPNSGWPWTLPSGDLRTNEAVSQSGPSENTVLGHPKFTKSAKCYVLRATRGDSLRTYYSEVYLTWFNPVVSKHKESFLQATCGQSME